MLTASEAYPEMERAFLAAETEIWASFRIFDLRTRLRSEEGLRIGKTWFDLIIDTLRRGVFIRIAITDFDPIACAALHAGTWHAVRMFLGAAEVAGPSARLKVIPAMHSSRTGILPRLAFLPKIRGKLRGTCRMLNDLGPAERQAYLRHLPGVSDHLFTAEDGRIGPRTSGLPTLYPATHHQKLAVFDRKRLLIGGLDLNERRYDTLEHLRPGEETWHDVQVMLEGPIVAEAQAHLETYLDVVAGRADPPPPRKFLRTLSRSRDFVWPFFGPKTVATEIFEAHTRLSRRAEKLIYLETQFFRDRQLARHLAEVGRSNPDLGLILILPAAPEDVAFEGNDGLDAKFGEFLQAQSLRILQRGFGPRLFVGGAAQPRHAGPSRTGNGRDRLRGAPLVYIHAKVSVFDDRAAIVSSANLNGRSLRWDTEAGVLIDTPDDVAHLRRRLMEHWLPAEAGPEFYQLGTGAVREWRRLAIRNARRDPDAREGFILPYDLKKAERFGEALPVVPEEMV